MRLRLHFPIAFILLSYSVAASPDSARQKMDAVFDTLAINKQFLGSLSILSKGKVVYSRTVTMNSANVPSTAGTFAYRIGSVTKTFTAVLIMQLIQEGKLKMETRLDQFFPSVANSDRITIEHLLSHRSGIPDYVGHRTFKNYYLHNPDRLEMIDRISHFKPSFKPGSKSDYSSSNYLLLSWIVEELRKMPYAVAVDSFIAQPLNLRQTRSTDVVDSMRNELLSYQWIQGDWGKSQTWGAVAGGAGNMVSTSSELGRFLSSLLTGKILPTQFVEQMQHVTGMLKETNGIGLGLLSVDYEGRTSWGHAGSMEGYNSIVLHFPDDTTTFSLLSNGGERYSTNKLLDVILNTWYGKPAQLPTFPSLTPIVLDPKTLEKYTGRYVCVDHKRLKIRFAVVQDTLTAYVAGEPPSKYEPLSQDVFQYIPYNITIQFLPLKDDGMSMKYMQNQLVLRFERRD